MVRSRYTALQIFTKMEYMHVTLTVLLVVYIVLTSLFIDRWLTEVLLIEGVKDIDEVISFLGADRYRAMSASDGLTSFGWTKYVCGLI